MVRRLVLAALAIALATCGYFLFIPHTVVDRSSLSSLAVSKTALPGLPRAPTAKRTASGSSSSFASLKESATKDPAATSVYEVQWAGPSSSERSAVLAVQLVSRGTTARALFKEAQSQYSSPGALKGSSYKFLGHFPTGVRGAVGSSFALSTKASSHVYVEVLRVGRVVVIEYVAAPASELTAADAAALGHREWLVLRRVEPGFTLAKTSFPAFATLVYVGGCVVALGAVVMAVWSTRALRRSRLRRQTSLTRSEHHTRGSKVLRRHSYR